MDQFERIMLKAATDLYLEGVSKKSMDKYEAMYSRYRKKQTELYIVVKAYWIPST